MRKAIFVAATTAMLGGCSFQGAIDAMVPPERQAEIIRTAQALCRAPESLQLQFDPQLFAQSRQQFVRLPRECPGDMPVDWRLATYSFNTSATLGGRSERRETALVVAGDTHGPWSEVQLSFRQIDGTAKIIIGWNVTRTASRPPSLGFIDSYDSIRWWGLGGTGAALLALITALLWVRRRRKAQGKGWTDA